MSCVSYAVGLGNIWRFPYLCYRNGGAVFLVPYIIFLVLCGMPLFFLEVSYGQFASLSPITVWKLSPLFKGVGYGMVLISGIVCIYYNIIITWTIYFLFRSFAKELPWATCDNEWNTEHCALHAKPHINMTVNMTEHYSTMEPTTMVYTDASGLPINLTKKTTPSEEFWERRVLKISDGIETMGGIQWELFGCLFLAWVLVALCLVKGIKSSGKVVYFTATFPYIVLITLLIRGVTLPGAKEGILFYVIPQWEKLGSLKVWGEAAMQIFYSVGAAWGALITMSSYNRFNNDCYRDARIIPILNCGTSIFSGFVIFSIIGFMAQETGSTIEETVRQGPGLVFIVYPAAVAAMPVSQIWSIMFFAMLLSVGLGSQFAMFQTMTSAFMDEFEWLRKKKTLLMIALCLLEFLLGIPCICQGGIYYLQIMDWYSSTFSLMILSFTELMVIAWIYGAEQFYRDIEIMIGYRPCLWWKILWCFITPFVIMFVLMFSIINHMPVTYGDYEYPNWSIGVGWIFALCSLIPLPAVAIFKILTTPGPIIQRLKKLVHHTDDWGPSLEKNRIQWENMNKTHGIGPVDVEMQQPFTSPTVYPVKELNDLQPVETNHVEEPPSYNAL
jgi:solute carrier family 6 amino acid transporter-like protein 5/7/9/14